MKDQSLAPGPRYHSTIELLRTTEALWNASRIFFSRWELSPSQFNILNLLQDRVEGCSQTELSRQLITHRSNITGLVDRLEERGLVRRQDNPGDRRAFNVLLTLAGRRLMRQIQPHYYRAAELVWGELPALRADEIVRELSAVSLNAERIAITSATKPLLRRKVGRSSTPAGTLKNHEPVNDTTG